jgi:hypothetical protein
MASPVCQRCQAEGLLIWYNFHCTLDQHTGPGTGPSPCDTTPSQGERG